MLASAEKSPGKQDVQIEVFRLSCTHAYKHAHMRANTCTVRAGRAFAGSRGRGRGAFARTWQFPLEAVSTKDLELLGTLPSPLTRDPPRSFKGKWPSTPL